MTTQELDRLIREGDLESIAAEARRARASEGGLMAQVQSEQLVAAHAESARLRQIHGVRTEVLEEVRAEIDEVRQRWHSHLALQALEEVDLAIRALKEKP